MLIVYILCCSDYSKNFCDDEEQVRVESSRSCSEFMWAVLEGYSLDRDASGFGGMSDTELQGKINQWTRDPTGSPDCSFYKLVIANYFAT